MIPTKTIALICSVLIRLNLANLLASIEDLKQTSHMVVDDIKKIIESVSKKNFTMTFEFKHSLADNGEITAWNNGIDDTKRKCKDNCLVDLNSLIMKEADLGFKRIPDFLASIFLDGRVDADIGKGFGWLAISRSYVSLINTFNEHQKSPNGFRIEGGGGSGLGFQMYCDNVFVSTAGAGGGGGIEGWYGNNTGGFNIGGGGGGGMQFMDLSSSPSSSNNTWLSVGGGGGCGTCSWDDAVCLSSPSRILCGEKVDDETVVLMPDFALVKLQSLANRLRSCASIKVYGGGGGGGGTAECSEPFMIGYGFSFSMSSIAASEMAPDISRHNIGKMHLKGTVLKDAPTLRDYRNSVAIVTTEAPTSAPKGAPTSPTPIRSSDSGEDSEFRFKYDPVGALLHTAAASPTCGGFGNWCCVCSGARKMLDDCLAGAGLGREAKTGDADHGKPSAHAPSVPSVAGLVYLGNANKKIRGSKASTQTTEAAHPSTFIHDAATAANTSDAAAEVCSNILANVNRVTWLYHTRCCINESSTHSEDKGSSSYNSATSSRRPSDGPRGGHNRSATTGAADTANANADTDDFDAPNDSHAWEEDESFPFEHNSGDTDHGLRDEEGGRPESGYGMYNPRYCHSGAVTEQIVIRRAALQTRYYAAQVATAEETDRLACPEVLVLKPAAVLNSAREGFGPQRMVEALEVVPTSAGVLGLDWCCATLRGAYLKACATPNASYAQFNVLCRDWVATHGTDLQQWLAHSPQYPRKSNCKRIKDFSYWDRAGESKGFDGGSDQNSEGGREGHDTNETAGSGSEMQREKEKGQPSSSKAEGGSMGGGGGDGWSGSGSEGGNEATGSSEMGPEFEPVQASASTVLDISSQSMSHPLLPLVGGAFVVLAALQAGIIFWPSTIGIFSSYFLTILGQDWE